MRQDGFISTMEDVIENSYKDYHVRGFDYICLKRTPELTMKLYFFDGDVSQLPEVVSPHDHRYDFKTRCLAGKVENTCFQAAKRMGLHYNAFEYMTPLNGGDGFTRKSEVRLLPVQRDVYGPGEAYEMAHDQIHTIKLRAANTILLLTQYEDKVALNAPTMTYSRDDKLPALSGLYNRFTPDQVKARFRQLQDYAQLGVFLRS